MREALGQTSARRRKPMPRVDPALMLAVGRIGSNLNQIARCLNSADRRGQSAQIDLLDVSARLVTIERQLGALMQEHARC
ncbi:MobC family plasmid mobilization relaxosome protein [Aliiroseovarius sp. S1339]|uniref:plasmid mobilization relaxosome protein MobC n=1 Tax=Aliiroseovarius sp. S1339 TaxID=2936990 RepID=UPI0020BE82AB|nr:plasmid mobilization relaxosome protein MobC [Aliiroseovarius sp. S1339]MCK8463019.1 MobC family plasmid mobilization relaxosome protein [Aliiroseovarius sp. S1339]